MNLQLTTAGEFTVVGIHGRIDSVTAGTAEDKLNEQIDLDKPKIIIDCTHLTYISSSGLRVLLLSQKKITANGGILRFCCLQPVITEIFDISGFSGLLTVFPDVASAMAGKE